MGGPMFYPFADVGPNCTGQKTPSTKSR